MVDKKPALEDFDKRMEDIRKRHRLPPNPLERLRKSVRNKLSRRRKI